MYEVKYLDLKEEFLLTGISADVLIEIIDKHNFKVRMFYEFGLTDLKRSGAFGCLRFKTGPEFTNAVMWYTVCEQKKISITTYPLIKKEMEVFKRIYFHSLSYLFAPFV
jgi:hypothetical protein